MHLVDPDTVTAGAANLMGNRYLWILGIALAGALTSACTMMESKPAPSCPQVLIRGDAASITKFVPGPGRDLIDVIYEGKNLDRRAICETDVDEDTGEGNVAIELMVAMELSRGPANRDRKADVGYFVVIADSEHRILSKKDFLGTVEFIGNKNRLQWTDEPVHLNIPLKDGKTGRDFIIYIGFGLTPDQLKFNRQQIEGTRRK